MRNDWIYFCKSQNMFQVLYKYSISPYSILIKILQQCCWFLHLFEILMCLNDFQWIENAVIFIFANQAKFSFVFLIRLICRVFKYLAFNVRWLMLLFKGIYQLFKVRTHGHNVVIWFLSLHINHIVKETYRKLALGRHMLFYYCNEEGNVN